MVQQHRGQRKQCRDQFRAGCRISHCTWGGVRKTIWGSVCCPETAERFSTVHINSVEFGYFTPRALLRGSQELRGRPGRRARTCEEARVLTRSRRCHMFFHVGVKPLRRRRSVGEGGGGCLRSKVAKSLHKLSHVRSAMTGQEETLTRRGHRIMNCFLPHIKLIPPI